MENQLGEDEERKTPILVFFCAPGLHVSRRLRLQTDHFTKTGSGNKHSESSSTQDTEACFVFCKKVRRISIRLSCARPAIQGQVRKRHFLRCHLYIKCIILPRQARDKHRENSKKWRFLPVTPTGQDLAGNGAKTAVCLSHLCIKTIFLPRQARDRHRERTQKRVSF
jgi:hypothetical protein